MILLVVVDPPTGMAVFRPRQQQYQFFQPNQNQASVRLHYPATQKDRSILPTESHPVLMSNTKVVGLLKFNATLGRNPLTLRNSVQADPT